MPRIIIKGTAIDFPNSGSAPDWSPAVIEAIVALTDAVNSISSSYDVTPQAQNIDANNFSINIELDNLSFPSLNVRAAMIFYSAHRATTDSGPLDGQSVNEEGTLEILYNDSNPIGQKWTMTRNGQGDAQIEFSITDLGQITFSTTALTGINHTGIVTYRALAVLNE